jgi:hypothetical protein
MVSGTEDTVHDRQLKVRRQTKNLFSANQRCEVIAAAIPLKDSLPDTVFPKAGQKGAPVAIEQILTPKKKHQ